MSFVAGFVSTTYTVEPGWWPETTELNIDDASGVASRADSLGPRLVVTPRPMSDW